MKNKIILLVLIVNSNFLIGTKTSTSNPFSVNHLGQTTDLATCSMIDVGKLIETNSLQQITITSYQAELKDTKSKYRKYGLLGASVGFFTGIYVTARVLAGNPALVERLLKKS